MKAPRSSIVVGVVVGAIVSLFVVFSHGKGVSRNEALGEWRPLQRTPEIADHGEVGFVPLGTVPEATVLALANYYRDKLSLRVRVLTSTPIPPEAMDPKRHQLVAENLLTLLRARDPNLAYFIGITDQDIYGRSSGYDFTFANRDWGDDWGAVVVSTARMDPTFFHKHPDPELLMARLKKMVTKNLAMTYYHLKDSNDPKSVLYAPVLSVDDLDQMGQGF